ncbi:MAG: hypothetical protein M1814_000926 [Vezdaea aestivalis]|nr:MAG: hypothetical protein M1814_000926 [Vezdaea aestivalis]
MISYISSKPARNRRLPNYDILVQGTGTSSKLFPEEPQHKQCASVFDLGTVLWPASGQTPSATEDWVDYLHELCLPAIHESKMEILQHLNLTSPASDRNWDCYDERQIPAAPRASGEVLPTIQDPEWITHHSDEIWSVLLHRIGDDEGKIRIMGDCLQAKATPSSQVLETAVRKEQWPNLLAYIIAGGDPYFVVGELHLLGHLVMHHCSGETVRTLSVQAILGEDCNTLLSKGPRESRDEIVFQYCRFATGSFIKRLLATGYQVGRALLLRILQLEGDRPIWPVLDDCADALQVLGPGDLWTPSFATVTHVRAILGEGALPWNEGHLVCAAQFGDLKLAKVILDYAPHYVNRLAPYKPGSPPVTALTAVCQGSGQYQSRLWLCQLLIAFETKALGEKEATDTFVGNSISARFEPGGTTSSHGVMNCSSSLNALLGTARPTLSVLEAATFVQIVEALLEQGADPNQLDPDGKPALFHVPGIDLPERSCYRLVSLLVDHNANIQHHWNGVTALELALMRSNFAVAWMFLSRQLEICPGTSNRTHGGGKCPVKLQRAISDKRKGTCCASPQGTITQSADDDQPDTDQV